MSPSYPNDPIPMRISTRWSLAAASVAALVLAACVRDPGPAAAPPPGFAALPDTTVCVVDRTSDRGLRDLAAKRDPDGGVLLLVGGEARPLESVHPVSLIAGYAGAEGWLAAGDPVVHGGARFVKAEGERRVASELLSRVGEHRGIPLFADPGDAPPPDALYVPVRPGCIFQAYVREELTRRPGGGA